VLFRSLLAAHSSSKERLALGVDLLQLDTLLQRHAVHPSKASSLDPEQRHLLNVLTLRLRSARVRNGLCEFADLIQGCLAIMRSSSDLADSYSRRFDVVLVDEFQDTNPLQVELLHRLCCPKTHVFAVGDDDQAIYGFRGADTGPILDFESHFPGALILKLETNYRSTPAILSCANRVFRGKADAYRKVLRAGRGERGRGTRPTKRRCASQADLYEWVARRIAAHGQRDGIPACSIALLFRLNQTKGHAEQYWKRLNPEGERPAFLTIHGAKGLEFPVVFLCDLEEGILPNYRLRGGRGRSGVSAWIGALFSPRSRSAPLDCDMEEEQRLFYVGVTRAQRYLYLLTCSSKEVRGITRKFLPSRFLRLV
jgi:DNA helicase II / ATP-dependent DNA helicase PcrA